MLTVEVKTQDGQTVGTVLVPRSDWSDLESETDTLGRIADLLDEGFDDDA